MIPKTNDRIMEREPKLKEQIFSNETSKEVRRALEHVVSKGTGRGAYVEGFQSWRKNRNGTESWRRWELLRK